jgi:Lamin Tail Domain
MKRYIFISLILSFFLAACVKDEMPEPEPQPAESYEDVVVNELIAKDLTDPYFVDGQGEGADWVELYNKGSKPINVSGMWITDRPDEQAEYQQIPKSDPAITTIPAKGFLVLICGAKDAQGADVPTGIIDGKVFINVGLSASKDYTVAIYDPIKALVDASGDFNGLEDDKSFGRTIDAGADWNTLLYKTPGAPNDGTAPVVGTLVINEFMASNDNIVVPGDNGDFPDWIEIYNTGDVAIDMAGWYATDADDDPAQYQLPSDNPELTIVPAKGFLILYCDGLGDGLHTNFKLSSGGEAIGISEDGINFSEVFTYCDAECDLPNPPTDFSCGRNGDGNVTWVVFDPATSTPPTPGTSNGVQ